jgi:hypothetical protein
MDIRRLAVFVVLTLSGAHLYSQAISQWTVKPEWVRAHEYFLASDAMRGRGSATPDELIAATYVASEFQQYGLKAGLPDGSYIQAAELTQPALDGKATISSEPSATPHPLHEGADFYLTAATGQSVSGPVQKMSIAELSTSSIKKDAVVVVTGEPTAKDTTSLIRIPYRATAAGARLVIEPDSPALRTRFQQFSAGKTPLQPYLPGADSGMSFGKVNVAVVTGAAQQRLAQLTEGASVTLTVHAKNEPRFTYNAVGVLQGKDAGANAKVILLTAHLDHLGIGRPLNGDSLYNGANDDASGTTAVMELARALAAGPQPQRTIYFVCYGSEELGGLGSTYFREHSPIPIDRIAANLEFEMIGYQDPKMPKGKLLLTGWDRSNLGPTLLEHGALVGDDPYPEQHFFERSDNYPLALKGVVAQTAAGWGTPPTYHKPDDDLNHLDFAFLTDAIQSLIEPVRWLANSDFVPQWLPGKKPQAH